MPRGTLYGFIGPNGAGKTTTLRMLAGLEPPTRGDVLVLDRPVGHDGVGANRQVGYMPDFFGVYEDMRVWEYLDFFGRCYGLSAQERRQVVDELLELVDLAEKRDDDVNALSRGMQQRLCLAHALVHDPAVLLLDEPASGLDPRARIEIRELLRELSRMGKTIVISSHILAELAEMCDQVGIIERGRLLASGPLEAIERQLRPQQTVRLRVLSPIVDARRVIAGMTGVSLVEPAGDDGGAGGSSSDGADPEVAQALGEPNGPAQLDLSITGGEAERAETLRQLILAGVIVSAWAPLERDLEGLFMTITNGEVA